MSKSVRKRRPIEEWHVLDMGFVLFQEAFSRKVENWWQIVAGTRPEQIVPPSGAAWVQRGNFGDGVLALGISHEQIFWELRSPLDPSGRKHVALGVYPTVCDGFISAIKDWLAYAPPLVRIGFNCRIALPRKDVADCYRTMADYLPVTFSSEKRGDFLYRINHRCNSTNLPELEINRLQTWSELLLTNVFLRTGKSKDITDSHFVCLLHVDINTDPDRSDILPSEKLPYLIEELVERATEIIEKGDRQ